MDYSDLCGNRCSSEFNVLLSFKKCSTLGSDSNKWSAHKTQYVKGDSVCWSLVSRNCVCDLWDIVCLQHYGLCRAVLKCPSDLSLFYDAALRCDTAAYSAFRMVRQEQTAIVLLRSRLGPCNSVPKKGLFSWWHVSWNIPLELAFGNKSALSGSICMYGTEELLYWREFVWFGPLGMVQRGSHASQASA